MSALDTQTIANKQMEEEQNMLGLGITSQSKNEKPKKTYKKSVTKPTKLSSEDYIKLLQEKIQMIEYLDTIDVRSVVPTVLVGNNAKLINEFIKEHTQLIDKYIGIIQNL